MSFQEKRLRDRKTESEESLQKRLRAAAVDMEFSKYLFREKKNCIKTDQYLFLVGKEPGVFDVVVVNDNLDDAYIQLKQALLKVSSYYHFLDKWLECISLFIFFFFIFLLLTITDERIIFISKTVSKINFVFHRPATVTDMLTVNPTDSSGHFLGIHFWLHSTVSTI